MSKIEVRLNFDSMPTGSDLAVVNAARRSFNKRSEWVIHEVGHDNFYRALKPEDERLIKFLARGMTAANFDKFCESNFLWNWLDEDAPDIKILINSLWQWRNTPTHDTPFNHCFISFEVKAPIFVARQLVKHEYLIMSEFSRRYITDDVEFYEPDYWRKSSPNKKQGSLEEPVDYAVVEEFHTYNNFTAIKTYKDMLSAGVAPEQARMVLPQSTMTEWTWSGTLGAFAKMCQLRLHPEAQYEARIVAEKVYNYLKTYYPVSAKALVEGADV